MVFYDSATLDVSKATDFERNVYNPFYLTREWWQRVLGDIVINFSYIGGYMCCLLYESALKTNIRFEGILSSISLNVPE